MNIIEGTKKRVEFTNEEIETLKKSFCILQEVYDILEEDSYVRIIKKVFDEVFDEEKWDKEKYEAKCYEHLAKILRRKDEKELSKIYEKLLKIKG